MTEPTYQARCFCGAIRIEARGVPMISGYCHCQDCRDWSGAPMASFVMWPFEAVTITQGEEHLALFSRIPETPRGWCARCGGHIGAFRKDAEPPTVASGPHVFPELSFVPTLHVFCTEAVIAIDDDLPKYRDLPQEMGGSGELIPELRPS